MPNKKFDLDNNITMYNCKILLSDKYSDNVVSEINEKTNYIYINSIYAINAQEELNQKLINFIKNYRRGKIEILSTSLISDEILQAIASNTHITSVSLGSSTDVYVLTRESFDILAKSDSIYSILTEEVNGEYTSREKEIISFFNAKEIVDIYTYDMLNSNHPIHFISPITQREIENLRKYSQNNLKIYFEYFDIYNIQAIIEALRGKNAEYIFRDKKIIKENKEIFKKYADENIFINDIEIKRYLEVESILDLAIKDIKDSSLSPYEKYLAVFKIVKDFKPYHEENFMTPASYDLYRILFSNFIVCRGFSELMVDLLKRVGINATFMHVEILKTEQDINYEIKDYHSRVIFRLVDPKYDIDGIFISDVAWDQEQTLDLYNHSSLTPYETRFEKDMFFNTPDDIFDIQSGTEFYLKLQKFPNSTHKFLEIVSEIDNDFYKYLEYKYNIDGPYTTEFFIEVYNYIITHTNKKISKETLLKALKEVIKHTFINLSHEDLEKYIDTLNKSYDKEQAFSFITNDNIKR